MVVKNRGTLWAMILSLVLLLASGVAYWLFRPEGHFGSMGNPGFEDMCDGGIITAAGPAAAWAYDVGAGVYVTADGGGGWSYVGNMYPRLRTEEERFNHGMGYMSAVDGDVCWYQDELINAQGGPVNQRHASASGLEGESFLRVSPASRDTAWVVTGTETGPRLFASRTLDAGSTWEKHQLPPGCAGYRAMALDGEACWVDGYRTTDGGSTWDEPPQGLTLEEFTGASADELTRRHGYLFGGYGGLKLVEPELWRGWGWDCGALAIAMTGERDIVLVKQSPDTRTFFESADRGATWSEIENYAFTYEALFENFYWAERMEMEGLFSDEICVAAGETLYLSVPSEYMYSSGSRSAGKAFLHDTGVGLICSHDGGDSWDYAPVRTYPTWIWKVSLAALILSAAVLAALERYAASQPGWVPAPHNYEGLRYSVPAVKVTRAAPGAAAVKSASPSSC